MIKLSSPIISDKLLSEIQQSKDFKVQELSLLYTNGSLENHLDLICDQAVELVKKGAEILVLSDAGMMSQFKYVPSLIATGAVHHRLLKESLRPKCSIIVNTAQAWATHHFACLIGYGCNAICPYMAYESIKQEAVGKNSDKAGYDKFSVAQA
jgi:glutamate synthase (ferredoxin)